MALKTAQKITENLKKKYGKQFGEDCVNYLGNTELEKIPRLHSGCAVLDDVMGGGWPLGRICEIYGGESSGKTTLCYHAMAQAQKQYPDSAVGFIDSEYSFDPIYATNCGVDVKELIISQPKDGQEALTLLEGMIEEGCRLVVVDSVAAMVPREEVEGEFGDNKVGVQARMMSQGMRKLTSIIGRADAVVIFTNQTRENIGVMYGNPECVTPDTRISTIQKTLTMSELFKKFGLDWMNMPIGQFYDVSNFNVKIGSYDHENNIVESRRVLSVVRKEDTIKYQLIDKNGVYGKDSVILECSGAHRIYDAIKKEYVRVQDVEEGNVLTSDGDVIEFIVKKTDETTPILDLEVEGNSNYFTNGILSHNTTPGGKALKFHASIRIKLTKLGAVEEGSEKTAIKVRCEAVKNKTAAPYRRGEYIVKFGKGVDNEGMYFQLILDRNLVQRGNGSFYIINGEKVNGKANLLKWFESHPDVYDEYKKKVDDGVVGDMSAEDAAKAKAENEDSRDESGEV